jgi:hypothetical protein
LCLSRVKGENGRYCEQNKAELSQTWPYSCPQMVHEAAGRAIHLHRQVELLAVSHAIILHHFGVE